MEFLRVLLLGIVEGMTEFLPVSSTGHLILAHQWLRLEPESFQNAFDVIIQLGAILSVVVLYWRRLFPFTKTTQEGRPKTAKDRRDTFRLWGKVIVGVIPAGVLGLLFDDLIDHYLFRPSVVATTLVLWGIVIILMESKKHRARYQSVHDLPLGLCLAIGCCQCLAMIPGTSRSAATIIGAMLLGVGRVAAAEFSFYLAIPTMAGATLLKVVKNAHGFSSHEWLLILFGAVVSFIAAIVVIRTFMDYIKNHDFKVFGIYRIIVGILVFALLVLGH